MVSRRRRRLIGQVSSLNPAGTDPAQGGGDGIITIQQSWDAAGRLATHRRQRQHHDLPPRAGRVVVTDYPDGTQESATFNLDGELQDATRQDGTLVAYQRDAEGRPADVAVTPSVNVTGTLAQQLGHDGLGRMTLSKDDNGGLALVTMEYWHDSLSRTIRESQQVSGFTTEWTESSWQAGSLLIGQTYPGGRVVSREHDAAGRLAEGGPFVSDEYWTRGAPDSVTPGTIRLDHTRMSGRTGRIEESRVIYDEYGRIKCRVDNTDHLRPESHSNPHLHEFEYGPGYDPSKEAIHNLRESTP